MNESVVRQSELAGPPIVLEDAEWRAKYVFPFFDLEWQVSFLLLDVLGQPPRTWAGGRMFREGELRISARAEDLGLLASLDRGRLERALHFDPWWVFLGGPRLPDDLRAAVLQTNVAGRYHALDVPRKVEDVAFDDSLTRVLTVHTTDDYFHRKTFAEGELDLGKLRVSASGAAYPARRPAP